MQTSINFITPNDDGWEVISTIQWCGLAPLKLLAELITDENIYPAKSDDRWTMSMVLRDRIIELANRVESVIKEQQANRQAVQDAGSK